MPPGCPGCLNLVWLGKILQWLWSLALIAATNNSLTTATTPKAVTQHSNLTNSLSWSVGTSQPDKTQHPNTGRAECLVTGCHHSPPPGVTLEAFLGETQRHQNPLLEDVMTGHPSPGCLLQQSCGMNRYTGGYHYTTAAHSILPSPISSLVTAMGASQQSPRPQLCLPRTLVRFLWPWLMSPDTYSKRVTG